MESCEGEDLQLKREYCNMQTWWMDAMTSSRLFSVRLAVRGTLNLLEKSVWAETQSYTFDLRLILGPGNQLLILEA
ncbi:hypothetical protein N7533_002715 [Penicillium manginii]|uniref:uncharacterized protein n=1 Tax=Penicillium manginii TaxID=203109 RepID=UPI002547C402|nr:uncharacterized protein N7533_002715 [Penicillium manginii]KAJ5764034.1 hypothetical protein N7533_002715 [Penicillium manginii]